jgi:hypothetical protein
MPTATANVVTTVTTVTGAIHLRFGFISNLLIDSSLLIDRHFEQDKRGGRHLNSH